MYQGGTFPSYFINTAYLRKPDKNTGRLMSIRKPRVGPKYGEIRVEKPSSDRQLYTQNRNQRLYDKLMLKAMSDMESGRNKSLLSATLGSSAPLPPTPEDFNPKQSPFVLHASNTAFQYKQSFKQTPLPLRFSKTPHETQRLLQHDILARSSLSSYASRNNIPSPMRSLYSRHVVSRPSPYSQPPALLSPRQQLTYVNLIM